MNFADKKNSKASIKKGAIIVSIGTITSRILGLIRDTVIASLFNRFITDSFYVAFTIPNVLRRLVGEGALTMAFIPVFSEVLEKKGEKKGKEYLSSVVAFLLSVLIILTILGILLAPWIVKAYSYGFKYTPGKLELTIYLTKVMFPFLIFIGLAALSMGVLNTLNHFTAPSFAPALLNITLILSAIFLTKKLKELNITPALALAIGILLGGFFHLGIQLPPLIKKGYLVLPLFKITDELKRTIKLLGPALLGVSIYQIDILISRLFASFLKEGSVTYLYYTIRLTELPQGIFILAIATATLPTLSKLSALNRFDELTDTYIRAVKFSIFIALPSAVGLFSLALPIVNVLFQRGKFSFEDTILTAQAIYYLSPSIIFVSIIRQTTPLFYSLKDSITPVKGSIINLIVYIFTAYIFMKFLEHKGIALGITLASIIHCSYLLIKVKKRLKQIKFSLLFYPLIKILLISIVMGSFAWNLSKLSSWDQPNSIKNILLLFIIIFFSILLYFSLSILLKIEEGKEILSSIKRAIKRF